MCVDIHWSTSGHQKAESSIQFSDRILTSIPSQPRGSLSPVAMYRHVSHITLLHVELRPGRLPTICSFLFLFYTNFGLVSVKIVFRIVQQVDKYSRHGLPLSALPERADRQEQPHSPDCRTSQPSDLGYNLHGRKFHDDSWTRPSAFKNRRWNEVWSFKTLSFLQSN